MKMGYQRMHITCCALLILIVSENMKTATAQTTSTSSLTTTTTVPTTVPTTTQLPRIGDSCSNDTSCIWDNSVCQNNMCQCKNGSIQVNSTTCIKEAPVAEQAKTTIIWYVIGLAAVLVIAIAGVVLIVKRRSCLIFKKMPQRTAMEVFYVQAAESSDEIPLESDFCGQATESSEEIHHESGLKLNPIYDSSDPLPFVPVHTTATKPKKPIGLNEDSNSYEQVYKIKVNKSEDNEAEWRTEMHEIFLDGFCKPKLQEFLSAKRSDFVMENLLQEILANKNKEAMSTMMGCICEKFKDDFGDKTMTMWMGLDYRGEKTGQEVLVCFHSSDIEPKVNTFLNLPVIYRRYDAIEMEPLENRLKPNYQRMSLDKNDAVTVQHLIIEQWENLFKIHTNLNAILPSSVKSSRNGVSVQTSILLYCRFKSIIPFGEPFFPTELKLHDKCYPTDIREGYFSLGMMQPQGHMQHPHPHALNNPLRMGCSIGALGSNLSGTIGPFVRLDNSDICFLTCAHVLGINNSLSQPPVVQPADSVSGQLVRGHKCGTFIRETFNPSLQVGIDAALVLIDRTARNVDLGSFAWIDVSQLLRAGFSETQLPAFEDGIVITEEEELDELLDKRLIKFGKTTGLTQGVFAFNGAMLKIDDALLSFPNGMSVSHGLSPNNCIMKGQIIIQNIGNEPFFSCGDSGAGIYVVNRSRGKLILALVGIGIGYLTPSEAVMTPIGSVLTALGLQKSSIITYRGMETDQ